MWYTTDLSGTATLVAAAGDSEDQATKRLEALFAITAVPESEVEVEGEQLPARFEAILCVEEERTTDLREIAANALTWRELPIALTNALDVGDDHYGAIVAKIEDVRRVGNEIKGSGSFDLGSDAGMEASRLVRDQVKRWVSVDLEIISMEWIREDPDCVESEENGFYCPEVMRVTEGRIMGAAMCAFSAFPSAVIVPEGTKIPAATEDGRPEAIAASVRPANGGIVWPSGSPQWLKENPNWVPDVTFRIRPEAVVAHAALAKPPAAWFAEPDLEGVDRLKITDEGHIYGWLAVDDQCHIGYGPNCVTAPMSRTGHAYFHVGSVLTDEGEIATGPIVLGPDHAPLADGYREAMDHYAATCLAVADVHIGQNERGKWMAGRIRPGISAEVVEALRASGVSGDWRRIGGNLELISVLSVNVEGFPKPKARVASGTPMALVAAGVPRCACDEPDLDELRRRVQQPPAKILAKLR